MIDEEVKISCEYMSKLLASKNEPLKQIFYFFSVRMASTFLLAFCISFLSISRVRPENWSFSSSAGPFCKWFLFRLSMIIFREEIFLVYLLIFCCNTFFFSILAF